MNPSRKQSHLKKRIFKQNEALKTFFTSLKVPVVRILLIFSGTLFVALGILGIFLPVLPSTPFFLLASACYMRSSKTLYKWLLNNQLFGQYLRSYQQGRGLQLKIKIIAIIILWGTILFSALVVIELVSVKILLFVIAVLVSIYIISRPNYNLVNTKKE